MDTYDALNNRRRFDRSRGAGYAISQGLHVATVIGRMAENRIIFAMCIVWLASLATVHFWPPTWWLEVKSIYISNTKVGEPIGMAVDRTINRSFSANWNVTIRQWNGGFHVWCNANGSGAYRVDAILPANLDLQWWSAGKCHPLPVGKYQVSTSWTISGLGVLPDKYIQVESNVFDVVRP